MILVTGHKGFIGSHLFKALDEPKIGLDKKTDFDLSNFGKTRKFIKKHKPSKVIHLAGMAVASECEKNPSEAYKSIHTATFNLLEACKDVERFVYVSSSMVYGHFQRRNGEIVPATESDELNPVGIYGLLKKQCEEMVEYYGFTYLMPYTIVRPSAVYGPGDTNGRVVQRFLDSDTIYLDNGGEHQLDFTYVDDLVDGFKAVLEHHFSDGFLPGVTYNLTRGRGRTIKELAMIVKDLMPEKKIVVREKQVNRPNRGALSIDKARTYLGYDPKIDLEEGVRRLYEK